MSERRVLKFDNAVFRFGLNLTVRRGVEYADTSWVLGIEDKKGLLCGKATIERTFVLRFCDLTDDDLRYNHDPACRVVDNLYKDMCRRYQGFDRREIVTMVFFKRR